MRAIGYFSVQGGAQGETALLGQQEAFYGYCQKHGHQQVATFAEDDPDGGRLRYEDMLDYLKQSKAEFLVIIAGAQHLGDTLESSVRRVLELDALRAEVKCSDEEFPDPLQQALKHWNRGKESKPRGERIKEAMIAKAIRGEGLGKPPFGYRIGSDRRLEVVPDESAAVGLIFDMYNNENLGMRRIVRSLNERGVPTRGGRGWSIVTVRDILRNRAYIGTYTRFGMRVPSNHTAIIGRDDFRLAQDKMEQGRKRRRTHPVQPFLLSGLAYCASCGNRMIGVSRRQGWKRKDGSRVEGQYRYYQCQSRTNQGMCHYHTWRADALERRALDRAKEALESGESRLDPPDRQPNAETGDRPLSPQFLKALESAAAGITSLGRLRSTIAELDAQRAGPESGLSSPSPLEEALATGDRSSLLQHWDSLDGEGAGRVLRALVSRVSVGDDSVQLSLRQESERPE